LRLTEVKEFLVPEEIISRTEESLRAAGAEGYEMFVLWSGRWEGEDFRFRSAHAPRQSSYRTEDGLLVRVAGEALHRLNRWLLNNDEVLAAQVHAHPRAAYHSETDDTYPIVTALGGLSLVAADFAREGLMADSSALFRLDEEGWSEVPRPGSLLRVGPDHGAR
jgi:hypothetical protein